MPLPPALRTKDISLACALLTLAAGSLVLAGWALDIAALKSLSPSFITMKVNTAIGLMGLALSLLAVRAGKRSVARLFAGLVTLLATATLLEYLAGKNLGIDELLFPDPHGDKFVFPPGRPAPITMLNFILVAVALWASGVPGARAARVGQAATLVSLVSVFQALIGYAFGVTYSFGAAFYTQIALHTAALLVLLSVGVLALRPREGFSEIFFAQTKGGQIARRLIASAILIPPAVNYLQILGQRVGLIDADFGVLLRVMANVVFFAVLIWRSTSELHRSDLARLQSEEELRELNLELEQRVNRRTEQLQAANAELEAFSYSVSHDLRSPLRAMAGFSHALEEDYAAVLDAQGKDYLARIRTNANQMGHLIDSLLELARLGRAAVRPEQVDLSQLAREIVTELRRQEPDRKAQFVIEDHLTALADPRLIRIVLDNLIGNAWKFTDNKDEKDNKGDKEETRIEIGRDKAGTYYISDNGAGFDMAYMAKLFGPFQRLHKQSEFPGTGVGLATVQLIVRRHNGRIWAEAALGLGATFFFTLDAVVKEESDAPGGEER